MTGRNARSEIILDGGGEMLFRIARTGEGKPILLCTFTILNSLFYIQAQRQTLLNPFLKSKVNAE